MELPLDKKKAQELFLGKTKMMDTRACNNIEFLFTDGTKVALHIDVNGFGLPVITACTHCVEIK
jgi:hypothetical protein